LFGLVQIRMQAEYRSGTNVVRKGMIRSFLSMFREEGARGLYRVICKNLCIVCMMALQNNVKKAGHWQLFLCVCVLMERDRVKMAPSCMLK